MLAVSDSGIGMEGDVLTIFLSLFHHQRSCQGNGLGLATVYGIIKQSNGHIWVYSEPGRGPLSRSTCGEWIGPCGGGASPLWGAPLQGSETVLLVEDEDALRNITRKALLRFGYTVLEAPTAQRPGNRGDLRRPAPCAGDRCRDAWMTGRRLAEHLASAAPASRCCLSPATPTMHCPSRVLEPGIAFSKTLHPRRTEPQDTPVLDARD